MVNFAKSKMFCSLNIHPNEARKLSLICGMPISYDLRTYLGVPIVHSRINASHSKHIIEKINRKLAGWKAKCLSFAGKRTLIQAVMSTIPNYTMQTMKLPPKVCQKIGKLNRDFLWGYTSNKKRMHLVKWEKVRKLNKIGGLSLKSARDNNLALNAKLDWCVMNESKPLWIKTIKSKYNIGRNPSG